MSVELPSTVVMSIELPSTVVMSVELPSTFVMSIELPSTMVFYGLAPYNGYVYRVAHSMCIEHQRNKPSRDLRSSLAHVRSA